MTSEQKFSIKNGRFPQSWCSNTRIIAISLTCLTIRYGLFYPTFGQDSGTRTHVNCITPDSSNILSLGGLINQLSISCCFLHCKDTKFI